MNKDDDQVHIQNEMSVRDEILSELISFRKRWEEFGRKQEVAFFLH